MPLALLRFDIIKYRLISTYIALMLEYYFLQ